MNQQPERDGEVAAQIVNDAYTKFDSFRMLSADRKLLINAIATAISEARAKAQKEAVDLVQQMVCPGWEEDLREQGWEDCKVSVVTALEIAAKEGVK